MNHWVNLICPPNDDTFTLSNDRLILYGMYDVVNLTIDFKSFNFSYNFIKLNEDVKKD